MYPISQQLKLSEEDRQALQSLIERDWTSDSSDLEQRGQALKRWTRLWRAASDENPVPEEEGSNFSIPLVRWQILSAVAEEQSALFGDDADIIVRPRGKLDAKAAEKVKRFMTWRVKKSLDLFRKYYDFVTLKRIYGSSIGYLCWKRKVRKVKELETKNELQQVQVSDPATGLPAIREVEVPVTKEVEKEVVEFEGLDFSPENIEDWVVPKSAKSLEESNHFIRRLKLSVDEILNLRDAGKVDAEILDEQFIEDLYKLADTSKETAVTPDPGKPARDEKDKQAGLNPTPLGREDTIVTLNWTGKFRLSKKNGKKEERAEELVCFYIPEKKKLIGAARLVDIFPDGRIPFEKTDNVRDPNMFWGIGYAEILESISKEMDCIHNITTDAGLMGVGPLVAYKPMAGFEAGKLRIESHTAIPLNDPKNDLVIHSLGGANMGPYVALMPQLLAMAERLTGRTEANMGRQFSGPNAPRTYGQQALLQAESDKRTFLDLQLERETFSRILHRVWEADKRWLPKPVIFRVVEEDITMTEDDFQGDFDFDIGPPTTQMNRGQANQEILQLYTLALQNPYSQQNPAILMALSRIILERFGYPQVAALIPDPEQMMPPQSAETENARMLQGEDVDPHPADNHVEHIAKHTNLLERLKAQETLAPGFMASTGLAGVTMNLQSHIAEHQEAQKKGGVSINMMGRGAPTGPQMNVGSANPQMPAMQSPMSGQQQGSPQASLASLLNTGGTNIA